MRNHATLTADAESGVLSIRKRFNSDSNRIYDLGPGVLCKVI